MVGEVKWWNMPIGEQIGNAGSEVARAIRRKNKNDDESIMKWYNAFL